MAYDRQHLKVTWGFTIIGTDEIALTSLNFAPAPAWVGAAAAQAEYVASAGWPVDLLELMADLMHNGDLRWADYSKLVTLRVAAIDVAGLEIGDASTYEWETPTTGTNQGPQPQDSVVISLRSGQTSGSANYGRMYLPHCAFPMMTGVPYANPGSVSALAAAAKIFVNGVTDRINDSITAIVSPTIMSAKAGAVSKGVTLVGVGNVTDTQRRRRNRLIETYVFEPLA